MIEFKKAFDARDEKKQEKGGQISFHSKLVSDNDEMCDAMGLHGELEASYGPFSGKGQIDFAKKNSMSALDTTLVVHAEQTGRYVRCGQNDCNLLKLNDHISPTDGISAFKAKYGEYLIIGFEYGGIFNFVSKYTAESSVDKMAIAGKLSFDIKNPLGLTLAGSAAVDVDNESSNTKINANVDWKLSPLVADDEKNGTTASIIESLTKLANLDAEWAGEKKEEIKPNEMLQKSLHSLFSKTAQRMNVILLPIENIMCVEKAFSVAESFAEQMSQFFKFVTPLYMDITSMEETLKQLKDYYKTRLVRHEHAEQIKKQKRWLSEVSEMKAFFEMLGTTLPLMYKFARMRVELMLYGKEQGKKDVADEEKGDEPVMDEKVKERNKKFIMTKRFEFKDRFDEEIMMPHNAFMAAERERLPKEPKKNEAVKNKTIKVLSVDHAQGPSALGKYFNFDSIPLRNYLGDENYLRNQGGLHNLKAWRFKVRVQRTQYVGSVMIWPIVNGGSIGDASGRFDQDPIGNPAGYFKVDDLIEILSSL